MTTSSWDIANTLVTVPSRDTLTPSWFHHSLHSPSSPNNPLTSLWITQSDNLDILSQLHIPHRLRTNQHILFSHTPPRRPNHHLHTNIPIHIIHKHVELVQTAYRTTHGIPHRQQHANCAEGLFATGKGFGATACIGAHGGVVRLDEEFELFGCVVDLHAAAEGALSEEIYEVAASAGGDVLTEAFPAGLAFGEDEEQLLAEPADVLVVVLGAAVSLRRFC